MHRDWVPNLVAAAGFWTASARSELAFMKPRITIDRLWKSIWEPLTIAHVLVAAGYVAAGETLKP